MSAVREYESSRGWSGEVAFAGGPDGFAYRPGEVITTGTAGVEAARRMFPPLRGEMLPEPVFPQEPESPDESIGTDAVEDAPNLFVMRGEIDTIEVVEALRAEGIAAQPNHVFFAHGGDCCGPHPSLRWSAQLSGSPFHGSPFHGSPFHGSPFHGSPFHGSPFHGSPVYEGHLQASGRRRSSARPATGLPPARISSVGAVARAVKVGVLDTGMAAEDLRPKALDAMAPAPDHWEVPDKDGDRLLDPVAGHGTFIAGLIQLLAPGCSFTIEQVLTSYGDGDELVVARRIHALAGMVDLLNLSFGGYASDRMHVVASAIRRAQVRGTVIVASAGNDGTCRPTYPAAFRDVIGVGAVGPQGPAPFTNYGPWVRACAPGVDVVSWFFTAFQGARTADAGGIDPDNFSEWAQWSGTSFSAPVVVAALARDMLTYGFDAPAAVQRIIDGPGLLRIPDLGTVVNLR